MLCSKTFEQAYAIQEYISLTIKAVFKQLTRYLQSIFA